MAMNRGQVKKVVIDVLSKHLGVRPNEIKDTSRFVEDLGGDSLDIIELVMAVEEALNINIDDGQIQKLTTVGKLIDYTVTLKPEPKDYMKTAVQLRMIKNKSDRNVINNFRGKHKKAFAKMKTR